MERRGRRPSAAGVGLAPADRPVLAALTQAMVSRVGSRRTPVVGRWWTVWGSVVDIGSLLVVGALARREGLRLRDLTGVGRRRLRKDLGQVPVTVPGIASAVGLSALLVRLLHVRGLPPRLDPGPAAAAGCRLQHRGAARGMGRSGGADLPRLRAAAAGGADGPDHAAAALVSVVWAAQHVSLPFLPGPR